MSGFDDPYRAAELLERLLTDPQLRADFRRNPASIASQFGLTGVAAELSASGKALHTLEIRESRSSLAGVMMAAAAEGVGIVELTSYVSGHGSLTGDAAAAVNRRSCGRARACRLCPLRRPARRASTGRRSPKPRCPWPRRISIPSRRRR